MQADCRRSQQQPRRLRRTDEAPPLAPHLLGAGTELAPAVEDAAHRLLGAESPVETRRIATFCTLASCPEATPR